MDALIQAKVNSASRSFFKASTLPTPEERFREKRVLLVGSSDTTEVAKSYGFDVGNMAAPCFESVFCVADMPDTTGVVMRWAFGASK